MYLQITGFLPEPNADESLKFKMDLRGALETRSLEIMGWETLDDAGGWENELTPAQVHLFSDLLADSGIKELSLFIACVE